MEPCRGGDLLEPTGVGGLCGVVWTYPFVSWMCLQVVNKSRVARMVTCPSSSKWVCLKQSTFNWNDLCLYWWTFGGYTQFSDKATWLFAAAGFACRQHLRKERRNSSGAWKEIHSLHFDLCWLHLADFEHWRHDDFQRFPHSTHHSTHHLMHLCLTQKKNRATDWSHVLTPWRRVRRAAVELASQGSKMLLRSWVMKVWIPWPWSIGFPFAGHEMGRLWKTKITATSFAKVLLCAALALHAGQDGGLVDSKSLNALSWNILKSNMASETL